MRRSAPALSHLIPPTPTAQTFLVAASLSFADLSLLSNPIALLACAQNYALARNATGPGCAVTMSVSFTPRVMSTSLAPASARFAALVVPA
jgi:hypothetical protein